MNRNQYEQEQQRMYRGGGEGQQSYQQRLQGGEQQGYGVGQFGQHESGYGQSGSFRGSPGYQQQQYLPQVQPHFQPGQYLPQNVHGQYGQIGYGQGLVVGPGVGYYGQGLYGQGIYGQGIYGQGTYGQGMGQQFLPPGQQFLPLGQPFLPMGQHFLPMGQQIPPLGQQFGQPHYGQFDPWQQQFQQGLAQRGYLGPEAVQGYPYTGQSTAYWSQGVNEDPSLRYSGTGGYGLQQQLYRQSQQQLQQQGSQGIGSQQGGQGMLGWIGQQLGLGGQQARGRIPKGYVRSDERLKEDIAERLIRHPEIDASEVDIDAKLGVITLTGTVEQRYMKHQLEDLVENVMGVKDIQNHITVKPRVQQTTGQGIGQSGQVGAPRSEQEQTSKPRH